jgi:hypothetical protein
MAKMILGRIQLTRDVVSRRTDSASSLPFSYSEAQKRWVSKSNPSEPVVRMNLTQFRKATETIKLVSSSKKAK